MRLRTLLTLTLALGAVAVAAQPAAAVYKTQTARFHATLSGKQLSSWTLNQSSSCGTVGGSGQQTFTYHQKHVVTLVFWRYVNHDGPPEAYVDHSSLGVPITGSATRTGKVVSDTTNPNCRGTPIAGPPVAPPAPDCGTTHYNGFVDVRWYRPKDFPAPPGTPVPLDDALVLDEESPQIPFFHCPFFGPLIMQRLTHPLLPEKKVFGTSKSFIVKDKVHRIDNDDHLASGVRADTTVSWTMHLTRIG